MQLRGSMGAFLLDGGYTMPHSRPMNVVGVSMAQRLRWHRIFQRHGVNLWQFYLSNKGDGPPVNPRLSATYVRNRIVPFVEWAGDLAYRLLPFFFADDSRAISKLPTLVDSEIAYGHYLDTTDQGYEPVPQSLFANPGKTLTGYIDICLEILEPYLGDPIVALCPALEADEHLARGRQSALQRHRALCRAIRRHTRLPIMVHTRREFWKRPQAMVNWAEGCNYYGVQYGWDRSPAAYASITRKCAKILEGTGCELFACEYDKYSIRRQAKAAGAAMVRTGLVAGVGNGCTRSAMRAVYGKEYGL